MTRVRTWRGSVFIATSLDGFIARPDGDIEWLTDPPVDVAHAPEHDGPHPPPDYETFMSATDHIVIGRGTYQKVLTFDAWPYPTKRVLVLSTTLPTGQDGRVTIARDVAETVRRLNEGDARGVYVDGGQVIQAFLDHDLIDDLTLTRAPVLLGSGIPLFGPIRRDIRFRHTGTATIDAGMTSSHYVVVR